MPQADVQGGKEESKAAVAKAKQTLYAEMFDKLDTKKEENMVCRIAKQTAKAAKDIQQVRMMNDES